jgi:signal transduction histidine kinase/CheY-like chemotaxis protein
VHFDQSDPRHPFRLRRYFSLASGFAVLVFSIAMSWAHYRTQFAEHMAMSEAHNVDLTHAFANVVWPEFSSHLKRPYENAGATRDHPQTTELHEAVRRMSRKLSVIKIKIYNPQGIAIYSSVREEIGEDKSANPAFQAARDGKTVSELTHRGSMSVSEGRVENVDVLSTYLAIAGPDGRAEAVFELYSDVTEVLLEIRDTTLKLVAALLVLFALLYGTLLAIVGRADRVMQRQFNELLADDERMQAKNRELEAEIEARRVVEAALRQSEEAAASANRAKTEFLSSMSHELRTPMNAILGFAQLLESDPAAPLNPDQRRFVDQILKAGRHLLELINEVLDLARIEAGKLTLSVEPVAIADVLGECVPLINRMAQDKSVRVAPPAGRTDLNVIADYMRLKQSVLNLLSNAVKYNRADGSVTIDVTAEARDRVRISVSDTGRGIPASMHGDLFRPFHRLEESSSDIEGTGIGLALTRNLVTAMGGEIGFTSTPNLGSTFWIELPAAPAAADPTKPSPAAVRTGADKADVAEDCILYVEDNPANVELMEQIAKRVPARFLTAHNAELGIALAVAERPDLILMDINLPQMDGYEALALLKRNPATSAIPVMALTAHAMQKDVARGLAAGFVRYHTKPFQVDSMVDTIRELLQAKA